MLRHSFTIENIQPPRKIKPKLKIKARNPVPNKTEGNLNQFVTNNASLVQIRIDKYSLALAHMVQKPRASFEQSTVKIPIFPMMEFGKHVEMTNINPEFHLIPKYQESDIDVINKIKRGAGRLIGNHSYCLPKIKIKAKKHNSTFEMKKTYFKKFWYAPDKKIKRPD